MVTGCLEIADYHGNNYLDPDTWPDPMPRSPVTDKALLYTFVFSTLQQMPAYQTNK